MISVVLEKDVIGYYPPTNIAKIGDGVHTFDQLKPFNQPDMVDNLESQRTDAALAAHQGYVLKSQIDEVRELVKDYQPDIINDIKTIIMGSMNGVSSSNAKYLVAVGPSAPKSIKILDGVNVVLGNHIVTTEETTLTESNLDQSGAFTVGVDYYVYLCDDTVNTSYSERFLISSNSVAPKNYNTESSVKLGGFHYGVTRKTNDNFIPVNSSNTVYGSGWQGNVYNGIIPNSVWTHMHRPKCAPEGMVYLEGNLWGDIYLASLDANNKLTSKYNVLPITGTEAISWDSIVDAAKLVGKRLPTYTEFFAAALGAPEGTDSGNTNCICNDTSRKKVGSLINAVSSFNVKDLLGNVNKWTSDLIHNPNVSAYAWHEDGADVNALYKYPSDTGPFALIAGGDYQSGVNCNRNHIGYASYLTQANEKIGAWLVCESK